MVQSLGRKEYCYLCRQPIAPDVISGDHVVPKQFIRRAKPKDKDFDYAGVLPSHDKCNNEFGPERMSQKALLLLSALHAGEDCVMLRQHRDNPDIKLLALNSKYLPGFTHQDVEFFKLIDVRDKQYTEWSTPTFFSDKQKTDPFEKPLHVALSVLTKSAAALLVSRYLGEIPVRWRVVAVPYFDESNSVDFDELLGNTKPFDIGLKVWIRPMEEGDWFAIYKAHETLLYLLFWFSGDPNQMEVIKHIFSDADRFLFEGEKIMDLVSQEWRKV
jgi:hypothetical protein